LFAFVGASRGRLCDSTAFLSLITDEAFNLAVKRDTAIRRVLCDNGLALSAVDMPRTWRQQILVHGLF